MSQLANSSATSLNFIGFENQKGQGLPELIYNQVFIHRRCRAARRRWVRARYPIVLKEATSRVVPDNCGSTAGFRGVRVYPRSTDDTEAAVRQTPFGSGGRAQFRSRVGSGGPTTERTGGPEWVHPSRQLRHAGVLPLDGRSPRFLRWACLPQQLHNINFL